MKNIIAILMICLTLNIVMVSGDFEFLNAVAYGIRNKHLFAHHDYTASIMRQLAETRKMYDMSARFTYMYDPNYLRQFRI